MLQRQLQQDASRGSAHQTRARVAMVAAAAGTVWCILALAGDLRDRPGLYLALHLILCGLMLLGWRVLSRGSGGLRTAIVAALAFRIVAALGAPALSDDVHRYVWDGKVQRHGIHPYAFAPDDPVLAPLRDDNWKSVNHPGVKTIYPPLSQMLFVALAALGADARGFCLALGLADFVVVLLLDHLLRRSGVPRERLVLYAWNPLAIVETAGSGHVEPVGVALVLLAAIWIIRRRIGASTAALAAAIDVKLLPVVLTPWLLRRAGRRWLLFALLLVLIVVLPFLPYAATGPALGAGTQDYAERWARNALIFPLIERSLEAAGAGERVNDVLSAAHARIGDRWLSPGAWDFLHRHAWPGWLARGVVVALLLSWSAVVSLRWRPDPVREALLLTGGALLLAPTFHPWYALWVLPFAAATVSGPWLLLAALLPVSYLAGAGEVGWPLRLVEYLPPALLAAAGALRCRSLGAGSR